MVAGGAEYMMTDGVSGWIPLISGLIGVLAGTLLVMWLPPDYPPQTQFTPRTAAELTEEARGQTSLAGAAVSERHIGSWLRVPST